MLAMTEMLTMYFRYHLLEIYRSTSWKSVRYAVGIFFQLMVQLEVCGWRMSWRLDPVSGRSLPSTRLGLGDSESLSGGQLASSWATKAVFGEGIGKSISIYLFYSPRCKGVLAWFECFQPKYLCNTAGPWHNTRSRSTMAGWDDEIKRNCRRIQWFYPGHYRSNWYTKNNPWVVAWTDTEDYVSKSSTNSYRDLYNSTSVGFSKNFKHVF